MKTNELAALGYASQMLAFAMLSALFLARRTSNPFSRYLGVASAATALLGGVLTGYVLNYISFGTMVVLAEWVRHLLWMGALLMVLRTLDSQRLAEKVGQRYILPILLIAIASLVLYSSRKFDSLAISLVVSGGILMGVVIIGLLEQIYRNLPSDSTSSLRYVCVALFVSSAYDILFFLRAISLGGIETDPWAARGFVNVLVVVPFVLAGRRADFEPAADVPRQVVFYTFSLLALGVSIALWLMADDYVMRYDGDWENVASIVLIVAILSVVGILLVSASTRARVRVFLTKVFFRYKYDYRKEWLRFISTLSESGLENVPATAVRAVGQIVNSPGGIVWVQVQEGDLYTPLGSWRCETPSLPRIRVESGLVQFLNDRQWVIDLEEKQRYPMRYDTLELDPYFQESDDWWLLVPLYLGKRLFGFMCLKKPRITRSLNFEDHDLLRTVGRHVAMHINQAESDKRLAESRQFGAYNRLTAFLMHDLNNLIAQQSLVVKNAERFRDNPKFVDDAIDTIAHSVSRMRRLMEQLSSGSKAPASLQMDVRDALAKAVERCQTLQPSPDLQVSVAPAPILADPERLAMVFEHLIRNAQHATPEDGRIVVTASISNGIVSVTIADTGEGMTSDFIRERLFRPFESTKGSGSMGIGAYQARDYVQALGGTVAVTSAVGIGTEFFVQLPLNE